MKIRYIFVSIYFFLVSHALCAVSIVIDGSSENAVLVSVQKMVENYPDDEIDIRNAINAIARDSRKKMVIEYPDINDEKEARLKSVNLFLQEVDGIDMNELIDKYNNLD